MVTGSAWILRERWKSSKNSGSQARHHGRIGTKKRISAEMRT